jgi:hypothetical protein
MRRIAIAALLLPIGASMAAAQNAAAVRATCDRYLAPAFAKASKNAPHGFGVDCPCVSGFLIGRYGTVDAQVIVRLFAAAGGGSDQDMEAAGKDLGLDRIRAVLARVGKFQDLGREMNDACPELRKP